MSVDWKESMDERGEGRAAGGWIASGGLDKKVHVSRVLSLSCSQRASTEAYHYTLLVLFLPDLEQLLTQQTTSSNASNLPSRQQSLLATWSRYRDRCFALLQDLVRNARGYS